MHAGRHNIEGSSLNCRYTSLRRRLNLKSPAASSPEGGFGRLLTLSALLVIASCGSVRFHRRFDMSRAAGAGVLSTTSAASASAVLVSFRLLLSETESGREQVLVTN